MHDIRDGLLERERRGRGLELRVARLRCAVRGRAAAAERDRRDDPSGNGRTGERREPPDVPAQHLAPYTDAPVARIRRSPSYNQRAMIYCVIPRELADELYDKMVEYYKDNPNVTVIVDRRDGPDRRKQGEARLEDKEQRTVRDRRRAHPGTFPDVDAPPE